MSAEILSNMYWSKFGLLGFLEICPRMATNRWSVRSNEGVSVCRAVIIIRMAARELTKMVGKQEITMNTNTS
jgi:hypothetical protein